MKKIYLLIAFFGYQIGAFAQGVPSYVPTSGLLDGILSVATLVTIVATDMTALRLGELL